MTEEPVVSPPRTVHAVLYAINRFTADILMSWLGAAGARWQVEPVALPEGGTPPEAAARRYDLVILGSLLEDREEGDLLALVRRLGSLHPAVPVVIISDQFDAARARACIAHGARGFVPTTTPPAVAIAALTLVVSGGTYVPALALDDLPPASAALPVAPPQATTPAAPPAPVPGSTPNAPSEPPGPESNGEEVRRSLGAVDSGHGNGNGELVPLEQGHPGWRRLGLTPREEDVLALLSRGHSNRQIARSLAISENTAMVHVRNLMRKLGATNRTQAVFNARRALGSQREAE